jgi:hypothetical protein
MVGWVEWAKIVASAMVGMLVGLIAEPLKEMRLRRTIKRSLYYEIVFMYRAVVVALETCKAFRNSMPLNQVRAFEYVSHVTSIQSDIARGFSFDAYKYAKSRGELYYGMLEFPQTDRIYGKCKLLVETSTTPEEYTKLMEQVVDVIETAIYDGTFNILVVEDAAPSNMKKRVHDLGYQLKEPIFGAPKRRY